MLTVLVDDEWTHYKMMKNNKIEKQVFIKIID